MTPVDSYYDMSTPKARRGIHWVRFKWRGVEVQAIIMAFEAKVLLPGGVEVRADPGDYLVMTGKDLFQIVPGEEFENEAEAVDPPY